MANGNADAGAGGRPDRGDQGGSVPAFEFVAGQSGPKSAQGYVGSTGTRYTA